MGIAIDWKPKWLLTPALSVKVDFFAYCYLSVECLGRVIGRQLAHLFLGFARAQKVATGFARVLDN